MHGSTTSTAAGVTVRAATPTDLPTTAELHARLLPLGLFPRLGVRFLALWQGSFQVSSRGIALVATRPDGAVAGFLLGSVDQTGRLRELVSDRRRLAALAVAGALALLRDPPLALWFARTRARPYARRMLHLRRARPEPSPSRAPARRVAVLTAVAVEPASRGQQVGALLVAEFERRAADGGATLAELVVEAGPDGAAEFYEQQGWSPGAEHTTRDGGHVRTYRRQLRTT